MDGLARAATAAAILAACAGGARSGRAAPSGTVALTLVNRTSDTVCYLSLSPVDQDAWSGDVLGSEDVPPGETRTVMLPPGQWDLRTENCQHEPTGILRNARITRATSLVLQ